MSRRLTGGGSGGLASLGALRLAGLTLGLDGARDAAAGSADGSAATCLAAAAGFDAAGFDAAGLAAAGLAAAGLATSPVAVVVVVPLRAPLLRAPERVAMYWAARVNSSASPTDSNWLDNRLIPPTDGSSSPPTSPLSSTAAPSSSYTRCEPSAPLSSDGTRSSRHLFGLRRVLMGSAGMACRLQGVVGGWFGGTECTLLKVPQREK